MGRRGPKPASLKALAMRGSWRAKLKLKILQRDWIFPRCGKAKSTQVGHIVTPKDGGRAVLDNMQGLCEECYALEQIWQQRLGGQVSHVRFFSGRLG